MRRFSEKTSGVLHSSDLKTTKGKIVYWILFAAILIISILCLIPAIWVLMGAFKDTQEIYKNISFFPENLTWEIVITRISESWKEVQFGNSIINTLIMAFGELFFAITVPGFAGYALSRLKPKGTTLIMSLVLWTLMMPSSMRTVPLFISYMSFPFANSNGMFEGVSLLNTFWPMWLAAGANSFNVLLFKNCFDSISISYVEAAKLDGSGNLGIFFKIMLPLSLPVVIYVSIMTLNASWSNFFTPYLVLSDETLVTTAVKVYRLKADSSIEMNTYFMALILASVPPFLTFAVFQRYILGGVNVGGVKS
ncbi:MAG: carbohydrate ABC transporter permease [Clostridia bacterium]|nr:carbohydrate ABC transporter permease [Clostridia bacterium]